MNTKPNLARCAIFGVDPQNCFGHPNGGLYVRGGEEVAGPGNKLIFFSEENGCLIMFSADWHPPDSDHFKPVGPWPPHGIANTWDSEFLAELKIPPSSVIVYKGTRKEEHGYDPFEGRTEYEESTEEVLCLNEIKTLIFWGIATDYCVKAGVLTACRLKKYKVYVALDACRAVNANPGDEQKAIEEMKAAGAIMTTTNEILSGKL